MSITPDDIANCGLKHGLAAPAMIETGWGRDVAILWLGGLLAGIAANMKTMMGEREAYAALQALADEIAEPLVNKTESGAV